MRILQLKVMILCRVVVEPAFICLFCILSGTFFVVVTVTPISVRQLIVWKELHFRLVRIMASVVCFSFVYVWHGKK
jgi:hypothetical protein